MSLRGQHCRQCLCTYRKVTLLPCRPAWVWHILPLWCMWLFGWHLLIITLISLSLPRCTVMYIVHFKRYCQQIRHWLHSELIYGDKGTSTMCCSVQLCGEIYNVLTIATCHFTAFLVAVDHSQLLNVRSRQLVIIFKPYLIDHLPLPLARYHRLSWLIFSNFQRRRWKLCVRQLLKMRLKRRSVVWIQELHQAYSV